jgi:hypothetical protein
MPVRRLLEGRTFDLEHTKAICDAFDGAWASLIKSNDPLASPSVAEETRDVLAKRIILMAESGMRDPAKLQADALDHLVGNSANQN